MSLGSTRRPRIDVSCLLEGRTREGGRVVDYFVFEPKEWTSTEGGRYEGIWTRTVLLVKNDDVNCEKSGVSVKCVH